MQICFGAAFKEIILVQVQDAIFRHEILMPDRVLSIE